jgi:hypothetical protein
MEQWRVVLCPDCGNCPAVEINERTVRIGERRNMVTLTHAEWNELVDRIIRGELKRVRTELP